MHPEHPQGIGATIRLDAPDAGGEPAARRRHAANRGGIEHPAIVTGARVASPDPWPGTASPTARRAAAPSRATLTCGRYASPLAVRGSLKRPDPQLLMEQDRGGAQ